MISAEKRAAIVAYAEDRWHRGDPRSCVVVKMRW